MQTTVEADSFSPNGYGLYNMHGNVSEWVWDTYGSYGAEGEADPTGAARGSRKVYRGGGWNDFAKNMRSAYRAALEADAASFNLGLRLVRGAVSGNDNVISSNQTQARTESSGKILIAYFSWGGNTRGVAEEIQAQTGADLFEITCVEPYSSDYNTVLEEAQRDQNVQARPELAGHVENMDEYDIVMIGYPNWWASIPMPIASFLEEYDFSDKTILPFPTITVYVPSNDDLVQEITVNFDDHSYMDSLYKVYEEMCFYTLKTVFPDLEDEKIINLYTTLNQLAYENVMPVKYASGAVPCALYYRGDIGVYPYFALGDYVRLCVIPVTPQYLDQLRAQGVGVYEIS